MKERLEEAAKNESEYLADYDDKEMYQKGFIAGALWQQEQDKKMYSDEEVFNLWNWLNDGFIIRKSLPTKEELLGWFEQFKKK
jgi:hypothetical protein